MFKELLAIYKSADDKTNLFKDQIPEDKYEAVMSALETEDEAKFNDLMKVETEPVSDELVETTSIDEPQNDIPIVENTDSLVEKSTLEEGPIVEQPEVITEDQQKVILPTLNAVIEMTNNIQNSSDEELTRLPEDIKEGVEIWKNADEDFSIKIIAETVNKFHNGDFSEIETPSDKDILITGAEIAKDLKDKGEHKTSLDRATEDIQTELEDAKLSDLLRIHSELCSMQAKAEDLVEDVIEKNDLAISPSKKEEIVIQIIDDNIYEDSNKDEFKKDVAETLNESSDYSSRDMSEKLDIFNDFSETELELDEEISPDTAELLESVDCFKDAKDLVEDAITEEMKDNPCVLDKSFEASINTNSFIDSAKGHARSAFNLFKTYLSDKKNLGKVGGAVAGAALAIPAAKAISETEEGDTTGDKIVKKTLGAAIPIASAIGGAALGNKLGAKLGTKSGDNSEGDMGIWSKDKVELDVLAEYIRELPDKDKTELKSRLNELNSRYNKNRVANVLGKVGSVTGVARIPGVVAWGVTAANRAKIESDIADLKHDLNKVANLNRGDKSKDCSEELQSEEQLSQEVIDNALSNDDQIRALVEKYKMLPTIEAKEQMKADMKTLGFNEEVINMIEQYAEGNFSEGEIASSEVCPNCGQNPCICETSTEETVDVASKVAPELFDSLLGPGVGETDPIDGTLPAGEVQAPGTEIGYLGTTDNDIPSGEPVHEDDRNITKVEIVNPEEDTFESIMR